jgi:hypothetical protein
VELTLVLGVMTLLGIVADEADLSSDPRAGGLTARHIPLSIQDIPDDVLARFDFPYVRFYRTEIRNNTDRPLKVVWFDGYILLDGCWTASNTKNRVLRAADFVEWYESNDFSADGWLSPGGSAACPINWHWTETAEDIPAKWAYMAVDERGDDFFVEAVVPVIPPEKLG